MSEMVSVTLAKKGRTTSNCCRARRSLEEEMRYMALVIFRVC